MGELGEKEKQRYKKRTKPGETKTACSMRGARITMLNKEYSYAIYEMKKRHGFHVASFHHLLLKM